MTTTDNDSWNRLVEIMALLRGENGCPWDREQTHDTLTPYLLEEAYEVLEALEARDDRRLCEELGDLLLQIVFHARLAEETGAFNIDQVAAGISDKLIERHPHVFGNTTLATAEEVRHQWEAIKLARKGDGRRSLLDGIPRSLPALLRAMRLQNRASEVGFDWENVQGTLDKVGEELGELTALLPLTGAGGPAREGMAAGRTDNRGTEEPNFGKGRQREEIGDLLFALVNLSRWLKIDPEQALQQANAKFEQRFHLMEQAAGEREVTLDSLDPAGLDKLWEEAKVKINQQGGTKS